ncbi:MAG TPA: hypothetical protein VFT00_05185 [Nocardioides sp.]|nr:hypothetical protein [Nocardioides sp.]
MTALGIVAATGYAVFHHVGPLLRTEECTASVEGRTVHLSTEQAENAALITAISVQRGMPARAASIALATAFQESKLYNLETGDRDSLGLFQQRPSQGWGNREEILNPYYATNSFYNALERVDGYESMRITVAAQEVQRSGYPEAYAEHEPDARVLASALTGNSAHAFSCVVRDNSSGAKGRPGDNGLTRRADAVRRELEAVFDASSLNHDGRGLDISVQPASDANRKRGWAIAQYLVAQADRLSIETVVFDGRIWVAGDGSQDGWTRAESGASPRDRVHVDVFR